MSCSEIPVGDLELLYKELKFPCASRPLNTVLVLLSVQSKYILPCGPPDIHMLTRGEFRDGNNL